MRVHSFIVFLLGGILLRVKGKSNIPAQGPYIICPNHSSYIDIFCIYLAFKNYFVFTGKKEIENWPLFHIFYTSGMNILIDRKTRTAAVISFREIFKELAKGHPVVMFPEGTISRIAPKLSEFKSGAFSIAIQKEISIIPVTFTLNWKRLQRDSFWRGLASPGVAEMVIHEQVFTKGMNSEMVEQLQAKVREIINNPLEKYNNIT